MSCRPDQARRPGRGKTEADSIALRSGLRGSRGNSWHSAASRCSTPRVISLNDGCDELDSLLRPLIGEDIEVMTVPANDLGSVKADPGQIEQVIMNLAAERRETQCRRAES